MMDGPSLLNPSAKPPHSPPAREASDALASGLFFIVGTGRCGTTLVQAMVMSHPRLGMPPETRFFLAYDPELTVGDPVPADRVDAYVRGCMAQWRMADLEISEGELREIVAAGDRTARAIFLGIMERWADKLGKPRVGEKTPNHFKRIDRIAAVFPEAKFVHVYRDPRDVALSMRERKWAPGPAEIRRYARTWARAMRRHFACERTLGPARYTAVQYERLVDDPEGELRRVCAFLGEEFDPAMLEYPKRRDRGYMERERAWKSLADAPVSSSRIGRYRSGLTAREIRVCERTAGAMLGAMGYERDTEVGDMWLWRIVDALDWAAWRITRAARSVRERIAGSRVDDGGAPRA